MPVPLSRGLAILVGVGALVRLVVLLIGSNETNQMNQTNQSNQFRAPIDSQRCEQ
jgi:hypothetical protein